MTKIEKFELLFLQKVHITSVPLESQKIATYTTASQGLSGFHFTASLEDKGGHVTQF